MKDGALLQDTIVITPTVISTFNALIQVKYDNLLCTKKSCCFSNTRQQVTFHNGGLIYLDTILYNRSRRVRIQRVLEFSAYGYKEL